MLSEVIKNSRAERTDAKQLDPYTEGLDRRSPEGLTFDALRMYRKGFREGVVRDFEISINSLEVPDDGRFYDAFLAGLAGTKYPGVSGEPTRNIWDRPQLDRSYDLGLKLLLLHLGYPEKEIESRRIYIRMNSELLDYYRSEAEKLRSELAA